jgi:glycosyltransferase involved in cell wall biosynthesis
MPARRADTIKRVLLVVHANAGGGIGGMETLCVDLGLELRARNIDVAAVVPEEVWADPLVERFHAAGARVIRLDTDPFIGRLHPVHGRLAQARRLARLWHLLRLWQPDVVHLHVPCAPAGLGVLALARAAGATTVVEEHNVPWPDPSLRIRCSADIVNRLAHVTLSVSRYNAALRTERIGDIPDRHAAVLNGIPVCRVSPKTRQANRVHARERLGIGCEDVVIGCLVRLVEGKGLHDLLRAFALVREEHPCRLLLVGDGPLRAELELQASELGVADWVHFAGQQQEPPPFLDAMDIFALAVPAGSMSIALLEAMARGLPPVITFCGPEEAVINGETGLCAPPNHPAGLAATLTRLVADPVLRARLAKNAAEHVAQNFSIARVTDDYLELYHTAQSGQVPDRMRADAPPNPQPGMRISQSCPVLGTPHRQVAQARDKGESIAGQAGDGDQLGDGSR